MKMVPSILIIALLLFFCAWMIGIVGFHYPHIIQDEPLRHPQKVLRLEGTNIFLEGGVIIALDPSSTSGISNKLHQSAFEIDVEGAKGEPVTIWARQNGWVCGTPWAHEIQIPLIRDTVYRNRREMIAIGSYVNSVGQPNGAANGGQAIRPDANETPSATGPRR